MKNIIYILFSFLSITNISFGQASYSTSCKIVDGTAYGYVNNHDDGFDIDGDVLFYFYDRDGDFIEKEDEYEYEYVSSNSTEEIEHTSAPDDACTCEFDISKAIKLDLTTFKIYNGFKTSCRILDGRAYGYVHNETESFDIDGTVWFYFYDKDGEYIDKEDEDEYEYVSSNSTEEIEHTSAPSDACTCTFDVSEALEVNQAEISNVVQYDGYATSCDIIDGTAYGYVHNQDETITINGNVWFYFYDISGDCIDKEDEYEHELLLRESTEEIEYTSAPSDAFKCVFDISEALD